MLLVGDLGGTKTLLASINSRNNNIGFIKSYQSKHYSEFSQILDNFISDVSKQYSVQESVDALSLAVAGPVVNNSSEITNLNWSIDPRVLSLKTNIKNIQLYNDLEAIAAAICYDNLEFDSSMDLDMICLYNPKNYQIHSNREYAAKVVIAPGTGLGVASAINYHGKYICLPSQGGHISFAPITDIQNELLGFMQNKFCSRQIGLELVCSGIGILNIFDFILNFRKIEANPKVLVELSAAHDKVPVIIRSALDAECDVCVSAIDLFIEILATAVQTVALMNYAQGGIYLAGGIAVALKELLQQENFIEMIKYNHTMRSILENMPIFLCQNKNIALIGASKLLKNTQFY